MAWWSSTVRLEWFAVAAHAQLYIVYVQRLQTTPAGPCMDHHAKTLWQISRRDGLCRETSDNPNSFLYRCFSMHRTAPPRSSWVQRMQFKRLATHKLSLCTANHKSIGRGSQQAPLVRILCQTLVKYMSSPEWYEFRRHCRRMAIESQVHPFPVWLSPAILHALDTNTVLHACTCHAHVSCRHINIFFILLQSQIRCLQKAADNLTVAVQRISVSFLPFSYHVFLKLCAKSHKPPHTPAHLFRRRSLQTCMLTT